MCSSVVCIPRPNREPLTCVFISDGSSILTCFRGLHFDGQSNQFFTFSDRTAPFKDTTVVKKDRSRNVCVLQVSTPANYGNVAAQLSFSDVSVGQELYFISMTPGLPLTFGSGMVAAKGTYGEFRPNVASLSDFTLPLFLINDASINAGAFGGPVFDAMGKVVGVITCVCQGLVAATPISAIRDFLEFGYRVSVCDFGFSTQLKKRSLRCYDHGNLDYPLKFHQRLELYMEMTSTVVSITNHANKKCGAGVFVTKQGHILTIASLVEEGSTFDIRFHGDQFVKSEAAPRFYYEEGQPLAILKMNMNDSYDYAQPAHLRLGMGSDIHFINPSPLRNFIYTKGLVSLDYMFFGWLSIEQVQHQQFLYNLADEVPLIDATKISCFGDTVVAPLFNSLGQLVGIYAFHFEGYAFGIDLAMILEVLRTKIQDWTIEAMTC